MPNKNLSIFSDNFVKEMGPSFQIALKSDNLREMVEKITMK